MIYSIRDHQTLLLHKSVQVLVQLQRVIVPLGTLKLQLCGRLLFFLIENLSLLKFVGLFLLTRHSVPYSFHLVLAVIVSIVLEILLVVFVAIAVLAHP